jgi:hypothetical protein
MGSGSVIRIRVNIVVYNHIHETLLLLSTAWQLAENLGSRSLSILGRLIPTSTANTAHSAQVTHKGSQR